MIWDFISQYLKVFDALAQDIESLTEIQALWTVTQSWVRSNKYRKLQYMNTTLFTDKKRQCLVRLIKYSQDSTDATA